MSNKVHNLMQFTVAGMILTWMVVLTFEGPLREETLASSSSLAAAALVASGAFVSYSVHGRITVKTRPRKSKQYAD